MAVPRIYFPFRDGELGYNCVQCGFLCCKGKGFGATEAELDVLVPLYPTLAYFTAPRASTNRSVRLLNQRPSCYFLRDNGHCDIQATHGRALKPLVCRSFPVNNYSLSNDVFVAGLHSMCPIKRCAPQEGDFQIRHSDLAADLAGDLPAILSDFEKPSPDDQSRKLDAALIDYEEWCRDLPIEDLHELCAIFALTASSSTSPTIPDVASILAQRNEHASYRSGLVSFLQAEQWINPLPDAAVAADIRALSATLRLALLRELPWVPAEALYAQMGRLLIALEAYLQIVAATGSGKTTMSTIVDLFFSTLQPLYLMTHLDRIPLIDPLPDHDWELSLPTSIPQEQVTRFVEFIYDENDEQRLTLAQILSAPEFATPSAKTDLLRSLPVEAMKRIRFEAA